MAIAKTTEESLTWIDEFGSVPADLLDLTKSQHQLRMYRLSTDRTKSLSEALAFAAQFDSQDVFEAYVDVTKDEAYFTFEMKTNTRPMAISLRYKNDRWSPVESSSATSAARTQSVETAGKVLGVKTVYHAFLDAEILQRLAELMRLESTALANFLYRINFKTKTFTLVAAEDAVEHFPEQESFKNAIIPQVESHKEKSEMSENEEGKIQEERNPEIQSEANKNNEEQPAMVNSELQKDVSDATAPASGTSGSEKPHAEPDVKPAVNAELENDQFESSEPVEEFTEDIGDVPTTDAKSFDASPSKSNERSSSMQAEPVTKPSSTKSRSSAGTAKYDTYSQSEVDNLIRRSAENVTSAVTTKINAQTKAVEKNLKNQEFAFNKTLEKLTSQLEQANVKLDKATNELNAGSAKQMEAFQDSLNKELDSFKNNFDKKVLPGIKLLDARLEQLAEAKKQTQTVGGFNPGVVIGVIVAIAIIALVNLVISWYAFERIANLEKSHAELMLKSPSSSISDVPVPDLMKEQIEKENQTAPAAP